MRRLAASAIWCSSSANRYFRRCLSRRCAARRSCGVICVIRPKKPSQAALSGGVAHFGHEPDDPDRLGTPDPATGAVVPPPRSECRTKDVCVAQGGQPALGQGCLRPVPSPGCDRFSPRGLAITGGELTEISYLQLTWLLRVEVALDQIRWSGGWVPLGSWSMCVVCWPHGRGCGLRPLTGG